jgi:hypothetical protein
LLGEIETNSVGDKAKHALAILAAAIDPIYPPSSDSNSEYDDEVYMVGQGDQLPEKTAEEIQREAEEEIAQAERLARELDKRKVHNDLQDDFEALEDEHLYGAPIRRHHCKFNTRLHTDRDRLRHRS